MKRPPLWKYIRFTLEIPGTTSVYLRTLVSSPYNFSSNTSVVSGSIENLHLKVNQENIKNIKT